MAPRIQRGVGEHRDANKFYAIQNTTGCITATAASAWLSAAIDLKS
jgi:hypothetical protein